jgi:hypothetical protein
MDTVTLPRSVLLVLSSQLRSALGCLGELGRAPAEAGAPSDERIAVVNGSRRHAVDMRHAQAALALAERAMTQAPQRPAPVALQRRPMAPPVGALSRPRHAANVVDLKGKAR